MNDKIKKLKEIMKDLNREAEEIGEDGDMVCASSTARGALIKFKRFLRQNDCDYIDEVTEKNISIGYLHLVEDLSEEERVGEIAECEWYVSYQKEDLKNRSPFKVWILII